jgi:hypothetical protein
MRRMNLALLTAALIGAGIGTWATSRYLAAKPDTVATSPVGSPSIAKIAPIEIMKERGKDLPTAKNVDPF